MPSYLCGLTPSSAASHLSSISTAHPTARCLVGCSDLLALAACPPHLAEAAHCNVVKLEQDEAVV